MNLAPCAEDMIQLIGDIQYGMGRLQPVCLQGPVDGSEIRDYDLLGARRSAQPVADEISRASGEPIDQAGAALELVRAAGNC